MAEDKAPEGEEESEKGKKEEEEKKKQTQQHCAFLKCSCACSAEGDAWKERATGMVSTSRVVESKKLSRELWGAPTKGATESCWIGKQEAASSGRKDLSHKDAGRFVFKPLYLICLLHLPFYGRRLGAFWYVGVLTSKKILTSSAPSLC